MEALARARAFRAEAQAARPSGADIAARVEATHQRAQERGQVEKTAGESGAAGNLKRKWEKWLASAHGQGVVVGLKLLKSASSFRWPPFLLKRASHKKVAAPASADGAATLGC